MVLTRNQSNNDPNPGAEPSLEANRSDVSLEGLLSGLSISSEPLQDIDDFRPGTIYSSSIVKTGNGTTVPIGFGYEVDEDSGRVLYEAQGSGRRYDASKGQRSPQMCFNCIDREDMTIDEKYHWRVNCPRSCGNVSLLFDATSRGRDISSPQESDTSTRPQTAVMPTSTIFNMTISGVVPTMSNITDTVTTRSKENTSPMTKTAEAIMADLSLITNRLESPMKPVVTTEDAKISHKDMNDSLKKLTQCVSDLTNLLVGDSYTDKAIIEAESFQVPVASREQYGSFQGTHEHDIKCTMPASAKAIIDSGMADVLSRANELDSELGQFEKHLAPSSEDNASVSAVLELTQLCRKQQGLLRDMAEIIQVNAYVRASVQDGLISALDASIRPTNSISVPPTMISTPNSVAPRSVVRADNSVGGMSGVTTSSLDDFMTPRKVRRTPAKATPPESPLVSTAIVSTKPAAP